MVPLRNRQALARIQLNWWNRRRAFANRGSAGVLLRGSAALFGLRTGNECPWECNEDGGNGIGGWIARRVSGDVKHGKFGARGTTIAHSTQGVEMGRPSEIEWKLEVRKTEKKSDTARVPAPPFLRFFGRTIHTSVPGWRAANRHWFFQVW